MQQNKKKKTNTAHFSNPVEITRMSTDIARLLVLPHLPFAAGCPHLRQDNGSITEKQKNRIKNYKGSKYCLTFRAQNDKSQKYFQTTTR